MEFHENIAVEQNNQAMEDFDKGFREKHDFDFSEINFVTMFEMAAAGRSTRPGSTDALKVAQALEGMHMTDMLGNDTYMRKDDHQLSCRTTTAVSPSGVKYDSENTGLGWKTEAKVTPPI